jgi:hypothetical protein
VRLFAIACFAVTLFYGWTAVDALRTGVVKPLGGSSNAEQRRDDPQSKFARFVLARWLCAGGFATLGGVMLAFAGRFEKLSDDAQK